MTKGKTVEPEKDEFTFDEAKHVYKLDGKSLTGVTSVIGVLAKPNLIPWAARMAAEFIDEFIKETARHADWDEMIDGGKWAEIVEGAKSAHRMKKEAAGTHGTDAHALVEGYIKSQIEYYGGKPQKIYIDTAHPQATIQPFMDWAYDNVDHFLFAERRMFNKEMFVAGTADFGCVLKTGQKLIGDFKTSSGVYGIDYYLQCAGYKILAEGEGDEPYAGCVIVRLGKKGPEDFDVTYSYDTKTAEDAFMACLTIYRAQAALKETASVKTP